MVSTACRAGWGTRADKGRASSCAHSQGHQAPSILNPQPALKEGQSWAVSRLGPGGLSHRSPHWLLLHCRLPSLVPGFDLCGMWTAAWGVLSTAGGCSYSEEGNLWGGQWTQGHRPWILRLQLQRSVGWVQSWKFLETAKPGPAPTFEMTLCFSPCAWHRFNKPCTWGVSGGLGAFLFCELWDGWSDSGLGGCQGHGDFGYYNQGPWVCSIPVSTVVPPHQSNTSAPVLGRAHGSHGSRSALPWARSAGIALLILADMRAALVKWPWKCMLTRPTCILRGGLPQALLGSRVLVRPVAAFQACPPHVAGVPSHSSRPRKRQELWPAML